MATTQPDVIVIKDQILRFKRWWKFILSKWLMIILVSAFFASVGLLYAFLDKPIYTAECTFVLEEKGGASVGLGQYSALASLAGIDAGSNGIFEGENIFELYKSRLMIKKALMSKANFAGKSALLIDRYLELNKWREAWKDNAELKNLNFNIPENKFTIKHDSIVKLIVKNLNRDQLTVDKKDKKLGIISVKFSSTDQLFAKAFTDNIVENVNTFYIQTKTLGSKKNVKLLQRQTDSIRNVLNISMGQAASAIDATPNPNPNMQVIRVPSQRKQVDVQASSAIYAEVLKNLEVAKATLQRETPLIQVIDDPLLPLDADKTSKLIALITGGFIGLIISILVLTANKLIKTHLN